MSKAKHIAWFIVLLISSGYLYAVESRPKIERACRDRNTGIVTITFRPSTDVCGSFVEYRLYGREDLIQPFSLLDTDNSLNSNSFAVLLNNKKWQFFISVRFACNGVDTFNSDSIQIDDVPPGYIEPDSVSVEMSSQRLIVGWPKSSDPDIMGYSLFKVDNSTGNNSLIKDTLSQFYRFTNAVFDVNTSGNRVAIAAFDSCNNGGVISFDHSPIFASAGPYNLCNSTLNVTWTAYKGWAVVHYEIYYRRAGDVGFTLGGISLAAGNGSYTFIIPQLGVNYEVFVRAFKQGNTNISSTSNIINAFVPNIPRPNYADIKRVSIVGDNRIEIQARYEYISELSSGRIEFRKRGDLVWQSLSSFVPNASGFFSTLHLTSNFLNEPNEYRLVLTNGCNQDYVSSDPSSPVILIKDPLLPPGNILWGHYYDWSGSITEYQVWTQSAGSFTWNVFGSTFDTSELLLDTLVCVKIASIKRTPATNTPIDTSFSNELCFKTDYETYIPTAFRPGSSANGTFKITHGSAKPGQCEMLVIDRWGGIIFKGDALIGWDGKHPSGDLYPSGVYTYQVQVKVKSPYKFYNGTFYLIR